jgi:hypothetical protein
MPSYGVELKISRDALERTLKQQLFSGPDGRYYLKGSATTPCYVYAENPHVEFAGIELLCGLRRTPSWEHRSVARAWGSRYRRRRK